MRYVGSLIVVLVLCGCTSAEIKDAGKQLGSSAMESALTFAVFGYDGLEKKYERENQEREQAWTSYYGGLDAQSLAEIEKSDEIYRQYDKMRAEEPDPSLSRK